ncbi:MAG: hypothetical protein EZS28_030718 [Streblomastix strix]|uniref:Uncharacterized protein n=1 Tax=Streblomastix strix TaxID=222440 RepID=A0A5J4USY1_9EUKA|nr:MAG: hypothetical protein EZS28_030718 [Streblomastix strix]
MLEINNYKQNTLAPIQQSCAIQIEVKLDNLIVKLKRIQLDSLLLPPPEENLPRPIEMPACVYQQGGLRLVSLGREFRGKFASGGGSSITRGLLSAVLACLDQRSDYSLLAPFENISSLTSQSDIESIFASYCSNSMRLINAISETKHAARVTVDERLMSTARRRMQLNRTSKCHISSSPLTFAVSLTWIFVTYWMSHYGRGIPMTSNSILMAVRASITAE